MKFALAGWLAVIAGCSTSTAATSPATSPTDLDARIAELQTQQLESDHALTYAERDVARLTAIWNDVIERHAFAEQAYARAHAEYRATIQASEHATQGARAASDNWRHAQTMWTLYRTIVMVAVAIEAGRYKGKPFSCDKVSTATFRRRLIAQGVNLIGLDIDHIVPVSRGGADHPFNYQVLSASRNRSLGNRWDAGKCLMAGRTRCAEALSVSTKCGDYTGPWF